MITHFTDSHSTSTIQYLRLITHTTHIHYIYKCF
jgi:hypothetical protein